MSVKLSRDLFDKECAHVQIDERLCKAIEMMQIGFITKNQDHINFFGGNLLGLHRIRFTEHDRMHWFDEIIQMDEQTLRDGIIDLPHIDHTRKVSSDTFNLSCVWLIHKIQQAPLISAAMKERAMQAVALMLLYRFFTSRYVRHFKYLTDQPTALATYNALSNKYDIKRLGSWQAVLQDRAVQLTKKGGLHWTTITDLADDKRVVYLLNDTQNRIRAMLKGIYSVFVDVHSKGIKVYSNAASVVYDGEAMFKDRKEGVTRYTRYMDEVMISKESFLKPELQRLVEDLMPTMSPRMLQEVLDWMAVNYSLDRQKKIHKVMEAILTHAYNQIIQDRMLVSEKVDITSLLVKIRGLYMASRNQEPKLVFIRKELEALSKKVLRTSNQAALSAVRTGIVLYVVLRAFTMNYYTSRSK